MPRSPFVRDVSAAQALGAWRDACAAAGCPDRVGTERLSLAAVIGRAGWREVRWRNLTGGIVALHRAVR